MSSPFTVCLLFAASLSLSLAEEIQIKLTASAAPLPPVEAVTSEEIASRLSTILDDLTSTSYRHTIDIDEEAGIVNTNCSGLAVYLLEEISPDHCAQIDFHDQPRARAEDFYRYFDSLDQIDCEHWEIVEKMTDIQAGDLIVYEFKDQAKKRKGNTGHLMIAMSGAHQNENGEYEVTIADSTRKPHAKDTRAELDEPDGLGKGTMWFVTDDQQRPIAYRWNAPDAKLWGEDNKGILIARAK